MRLDIRQQARARDCVVGVARTTDPDADAGTFPHAVTRGEGQL